MASILMMCVLVIETAAVIALFFRVLYLKHLMERFRRRCDERLGALEQVAAERAEEGDGQPEALEEERKKEREAERRFTEGVASILSFSCCSGGRKGE